MLHERMQKLIRFVHDFEKEFRKEIKVDLIPYYVDRATELLLISDPSEEMQKYNQWEVVQDLALELVKNHNLEPMHAFQNAKKFYDEWEAFKHHVQEGNFAHHGCILDLPRCEYCKNNIYPGDDVSDDGNYHLECSKKVCCLCDKSLINMEDNVNWGGKEVHLKCFEKRKCQKCGEVVKLDEGCKGVIGGIVHDQCKRICVACEQEINGKFITKEQGDFHQTCGSNRCVECRDPIDVWHLPVNWSIGPLHEKCAWKWESIDVLGLGDLGTWCKTNGIIMLKDIENRELTDKLTVSQFQIVKQSLEKYHSEVKKLQTR